MIEKIGSFTVSSNKLVISDPCYPLDIWCQGILNNVKNGKWEGYVEYQDNGKMCKSVIACHSDNKINKWARKHFSVCDFTVAVDSGQAGIFDFDSYKNDSVATNPLPTSICTEEKWYSNCCDATLSQERAGIVREGVVASSGYGDGSYLAYIDQAEDGKIVAVEIAFIGKRNCFDDDYLNDYLVNDDDDD